MFGRSYIIIEHACFWQMLKISSGTTGGTQKKKKTREKEEEEKREVALPKTACSIFKKSGNITDSSSD